MTKKQTDIQKILKEFWNKGRKHIDKRGVYIKVYKPHDYKSLLEMLNKAKHKGANE